MLEMVEARRNVDNAEQRCDLLSGLLDATQDDPDNGASLSDDELVGKYPMSHQFAFLESVLPAILGNMFIFLFAGHEVGLAYLSSSCMMAGNTSLQTTAHTLCFSFALLALHPDEQERLYEHIKGVLSSLNRTPVRSQDLGSRLITRLTPCRLTKI